MAGSPLRKSRDAHTETPVVPQVARRSGGEMRCPQTQQRLKDAGSVCPSSSVEEGVAMVRPHLCLEEGTALVLGSGPGLPWAAWEWGQRWERKPFWVLAAEASVLTL